MDATAVSPSTTTDATATALHVSDAGRNATKISCRRCNSIMISPANAAFDASRQVPIRAAID